MLMYFFLALAGIFVGITSGLLGIGGGVLLVPLLMFGFKQSMHSAIGTSLLIIVPTALCSGIVHFKNGNASIKAACLLFLFTVFGGYLGAQIGEHLSEGTLKKVFAVLLVVIAVKIFVSS